MNALRKINLKDLIPSKQAASIIIKGFDELNRDRKQIRHGSGENFKYAAAFQKINKTSFQAELGGPDSDRVRKTLTLYVKFRAWIDDNNETAIAIIDHDFATTYEQALKLAKHAIYRMVRELSKEKPTFPDGIDKSKWNGFYLYYSGKNKSVWSTFDDVFSKAVNMNYFPEEMREPLRTMGFNIEEVRPTKAKNPPKMKFHSEQSV